MMFGPAEAFTPDQFAQQYDVNVLGTQRVNRAVLPHMRAAKQGLLAWVSSGCCGRHAAVSVALLDGKSGDRRAGGPICPRARPLGHGDGDCRAGRLHQRQQPLRATESPADTARLADYEAGPYKGFGAVIQEAFAVIVSDDADVSGVAERIVDIVDIVGMPFGKRPFRVHYDPSEDGTDVGVTVLERLRAEMLHRVGMSDPLKPTVLA